MSIDREPNGLGEPDVERLRAEAQDLFDLEDLIERGRPFVDAAPEMIESNPDGVAITMLAAGIQEDPDAGNRFDLWAAPLRQLARDRFMGMSREARRDYAVRTHLRGAQEHAGPMPDASYVVDMMAEEHYDREYGWPMVVLYACLKDS